MLVSVQRLVVTSSILALTIGCSKMNPNVPSEQPKKIVRLGILVMGHKSNAPVVGAKVALVSSVDIPSQTMTKATSEDGTAYWDVFAGYKYTILVRSGIDGSISNLVTGDARWLTSLPE